MAPPWAGGSKPSPLGPMIAILTRDGTVPGPKGTDGVLGGRRQPWGQGAAPVSRGVTLKDTRVPETRDRHETCPVEASRAEGSPVSSGPTRSRGRLRHSVLKGWWGAWGSEP